MSIQPRHAQRHRYGAARPPAAVALLAIVLFLAALLLPSGHATAPRTFGPVPQATTVQPSAAPAAGPDEAARHREHAAHVAHMDRLERLHADHVAHLRHLARTS